jgi:hypothetical protein
MFREHGLMVRAVSTALCLFSGKSKSVQTTSMSAFAMLQKKDRIFYQCNPFHNNYLRDDISFTHTENSHHQGKIC